MCVRRVARPDVRAKPLFALWIALHVAAANLHFLEPIAADLHFLEPAAGSIYILPDDELAVKVLLQNSICEWKSLALNLTSHENYSSCAVGDPQCGSITLDGESAESVVARSAIVRFTPGKSGVYSLTPICTVSAIATDRFGNVIATTFVTKPGDPLYLVVVDKPEYASSYAPEIFVYVPSPIWHKATGDSEFLVIAVFPPGFQPNPSYTLTYTLIDVFTGMVMPLANAIQGDPITPGTAPPTRVRIPLDGPMTSRCNSVTRFELSVCWAPKTPKAFGACHNPQVARIDFDRWAATVSDDTDLQPILVRRPFWFDARPPDAEHDLVSTAHAALCRHPCACCLCWCMISMMRTASVWPC